MNLYVSIMSPAQSCLLARVYLHHGPAQVMLAFTLFSFQHSQPQDTFNTTSNTMEDRSNRLNPYQDQRWPPPNPISDANAVVARLLRYEHNMEDQLGRDQELRLTTTELLPDNDNSQRASDLERGAKR
jgi:hypothetical protein